MSEDPSASRRSRMGVSLPQLRGLLEAASAATLPDATPRPAPGFGLAVLDDTLLPGTLHELQAVREADGAALAGFALGAAQRLAGGRAIVWVRQDFLDAEGGRVHPPGLAEIGLDPAAVTLVRTRDVMGVLQAGLEAARCRAVGVVLIEPWGETRALDLTASRRLLLAAHGSGATVILGRIAPPPGPSAAETRWRVSAAPSRPEPANAPGAPAFRVELLRRRGGAPGGTWCVEWNRDRNRFEERGDLAGATLSRAVVPLPADRSALPGTGRAAVRRTG